jgi:hypothetical protein
MRQWDGILPKYYQLQCSSAFEVSGAAVCANCCGTGSRTIGSTDTMSLRASESDLMSIEINLECKW